MGVWGPGGDFAKALESKMLAQQKNADAATMKSSADLIGAYTGQQQADTNLLDVQNRFKVGMGGNQVHQFGNETQRLDILRSMTQGPGPGLLQAGNLRTFGGSPGMGGAAPGAGLTSFSMPTMSAASLTAPNDMANRRPSPGMRRGGMVSIGMKRGGMACGLRQGGVIGNIENNENGKDTVDVVAQEGEVYLNPKTVANYFGGGSYEHGVRALNQIIRDSTGEEPGPSPVGKSGGSPKQGFVKGGQGPVVDAWIPGAELPREGPNFRVPSSGQMVPYVAPPAAPQVAASPQLPGPSPAMEQKAMLMQQAAAADRVAAGSQPSPAMMNKAEALQAPAAAAQRAADHEAIRANHAATAAQYQREQGVRVNPAPSALPPPGGAAPLQGEWIPGANSGGDGPNWRQASKGQMVPSTPPPGTSLVPVGPATSPAGQTFHIDATKVPQSGMRQMAGKALPFVGPALGALETGQNVNENRSFYGSDAPLGDKIAQAGYDVFPVAAGGAGAVVGGLLGAPAGPIGAGAGAVLGGGAAAWKAKEGIEALAGASPADMQRTQQADAAAQAKFVHDKRAEIMGRKAQALTNQGPYPDQVSRAADAGTRNANALYPDQNSRRAEAGTRTAGMPTAPQYPERFYGSGGEQYNSSKVPGARGVGKIIGPDGSVLYTNIDAKTSVEDMKGVRSGSASNAGFYSANQKGFDGNPIGSESGRDSDPRVPFGNGNAGDSGGGGGGGSGLRSIGMGHNDPRMAGFNSSTAQAMEMAKLDATNSKNLAEHKETLRKNAAGEADADEKRMMALRVNNEKLVKEQGGDDNFAKDTTRHLQREYDNSHRTLSDPQATAQEKRAAQAFISTWGKGPKGNEGVRSVFDIEDPQALMTLVNEYKKGKDAGARNSVDNVVSEVLPTAGAIGGAAATIGGPMAWKMLSGKKKDAGAAPATPAPAPDAPRKGLRKIPGAGTVIDVGKAAAKGAWKGKGGFIGRGIAGAAAGLGAGIAARQELMNDIVPPQPDAYLNRPVGKTEDGKLITGSGHVIRDAGQMTHEDPNSLRGMFNRKVVNFNPERGASVFREYAGDLPTLTKAKVEELKKAREKRLKE